MKNFIKAHIIAFILGAIVTVFVFYTYEVYQFNKRVNQLEVSMNQVVTFLNSVTQPKK